MRKTNPEIIQRDEIEQKLTRQELIDKRNRVHKNAVRCLSNTMFKTYLDALDDMVKAFEQECINIVKCYDDRQRDQMCAIIMQTQAQLKALSWLRDSVTRDSKKQVVTDEK